MLAVFHPCVLQRIDRFRSHQRTKAPSQAYLRHIEESHNVELEDLHYGELRAVMRQFKTILYRRLWERTEREDLRKELALAGKTMLKLSQNMSSLVCANYTAGRGSEAESYNGTLEQFEKIAGELSRDAKNVMKKLKKVKR